VTGSLLGLLIEGLVALLLLVTIGYCIVLNQRLKRLRADESSLRETIAELVRATEIAERAIEGLKETAVDCDRNLTEKLRQADRYSRSIEKQVELGGKVLNRLSRITELARGHGLVERSKPGGRSEGAAPARTASASKVTGTAA
jgi:Domain of unknown function (DUF6468)